MAITIKIPATTESVVPGASNEFTTSGPFTLYADDLGWNEHITLWRLGPSGEYREATNKNGVITVSATPNMIYVEAGGTFRLGKPLTKQAAACGYEEA